MSTTPTTTATTRTSSTPPEAARAPAPPASGRSHDRRPPSAGDRRRDSAFAALLAGMKSRGGEPPRVAKGVVEPRAPHAGDLRAKLGDERPGVEERPRAARATAPADGDRSLLTPFQPPNPALVPPAPLAAPAAPEVGSAAARAEAVALVERLVSSFRVGRVGKDGHVVHMKLRGAREGEGIDVQLVQEAGRVRAVFRSEPYARAEADRLAALVAEELSARGVDVDGVSVE